MIDAQLVLGPASLGAAVFSGSEALAVTLVVASLAVFVSIRSSWPLALALIGIAAIALITDLGGSFAPIMGRGGIDPASVASIAFALAITLWLAIVAFSIARAATKALRSLPSRSARQLGDPS